MAIRLCYWHPDYIPPAPFCLSSKLTKAENRVLLDFEESNAFARFEEIKLLAELEPVEEQFFSPLPVFDVKKVVNNFVDLLSENDKKEFGLYNIQTNGGVAPKTDEKVLINRSDFLRR